MPGPALFGRTDDLATAERALSRAAAGRGVVLSVTGRAGIGKTAFLDSACASAADLGFQVVRDAGSPLQAERPLGVALGLIDQVSALAGRHAVGEVARDGSIEVEQLAAARLEDFVKACRTLADRGPVALVVDDVHWADRASLDALAVLGRRIAGMRVALMVAARSGGLEGGRIAGPRALAPPEFDLELAPLSPAATSEMTADRLENVTLDASAVELCWQITDGYPVRAALLAVALRRLALPAGSTLDAEHLEAAAPRSFDAWIARELSGDPAATRMLAIAALLDSAAQPTLLAEVAQVDLATINEAGQRLLEAGLTNDSRTLRPTHSLLAQAAVESLPQKERAEIHRRAAGALRQAGAAPDVVAAHLLHVEPSGDPDIVEELRSAAESEAARRAPVVAARYLRRALAEPPSDDDLTSVLLDAGVAACRAGDADGIGYLERVLDRADDPAAELAAVHELADAHARGTDPFAAATLLEERIDRLADGPREQVLELEAKLAGLAPLSPALHNRVRTRLAEDRWQLTGATPAERALIAAHTEHEAMAAGTADEAAEHVRRSLRDTPLSVGRVGVLNAARPLWTLLRAERFVEAGQFLEEGAARAQQVGAIGDGSMFRALTAYLYLQLGEMAAAEREASASLEVAEAHGFAMARDMAAAFLAEALLEQDRAGEAERALAHGALPSGRPSVNQPASVASAHLLIRRGRMRIERAESAAGLADLLEVGAQKERIGVPNPAGFPWVAPAVDLLVARGQRERAIELARAPLEAARRWGAPAALAEVLSAMASARGDLAQFDEAERLIARSEANATRARVSYEHGSLS